MVRGEGVELCVELLHWAAKQCDGLPALAEGTTLPAARAVLAQVGQAPEAVWPYDEGRNQRANNYHPPAGAVAEAKNRLLTGGGEICPTVVSLRQALDQGQPVVLGMKIHTTWYGVGKDGQIARPSASARDLGGHAVVVVGYSDDAFIVLNSWGDDWGDNGFGYIENDYVDNHAVAAWALSL